MGNEATEHGFLMRDGTSQAARRLRALDPSYVAVDERGPRDWLEFARLYGEELVYYGPDNTARGDWRAFLKGSDLDRLAADLEKPQNFKGPPHLALFLAFLKLLGRSQHHLNGFTRRHLDFYFQQVLQLVRRGPQPDRVWVLFELDRRASTALVPAGTRLDAGERADGSRLIYATDRDLVVDRAHITQLRSLYVDRRIITLGDVFDAHRHDGRQACLKLLEQAMGEPRPGDPLPPYRALPALEPVFQTLGSPELDVLTELLRFAAEDLYLSFDDLDYLMKLDGESYPGDGQGLGTDAWHANRWSEMARVLSQAGRRKTGDPDYVLPASVVADKGLEDAVAIAVAPDFQRLPTRLAGVVSGISDYHEAVVQLEGFFHMPAASFAWLMRTVGIGLIDDTTRRQIEALLENAHREKIYAQRRRELQDIWLEHADAEEGLTGYLEGFDAMLRVAAGEDPTSLPDPFSVEHLVPFLDRSADVTLLDQVRRKLVAKLPVSDKEWTNVAVVAELAQRHRRNLPEPRALRTEWLNLYAAPDATRVLAVRATEGDLPQWRTFGATPDHDQESHVPAPNLGWALSSPLLALAEGDRSIHLALELAEWPASLSEDDIKDALVVEVSSAEGWVLADEDQLSAKLVVGSALTNVQVAADARLLSFDVRLGAEAPAIEAPGDGSFESPTLRLMLRQEWSRERSRFVTRNPRLRGLVAKKAHLRVGTLGLRDLHLQHEDDVLDPGKPFEPFGSTPAVGSRFLLSHPELAGKKLDQLSIEIDWMDVPVMGLGKYYGSYNLKEKTTDPSDGGPEKVYYFSAQLGWVDRGLESGEPAEIRPLLVPDLEPDPSPSDERGLLRQTIVLGLDGPPPSPEGGVPAGTGEPGDDLTSGQRYLQWQLDKPDFQHRVYPGLATRKATEMALAIGGGQTAGKSPDDYTVNPPYTPRIQSLSVSYSASSVIELDRETSSSEHQAFHIRPFGQCPAVIEADSTTGAPLLPSYDHEGELLLGLEGVEAPQSVYLLFEMAEGSSDPDLERVPVSWSYLSGNRWLSLEEGRLLLDTTRGLRQSGVVELALEPAQPSTRLGADGLYWIRAAISHHAAGVGDTIGVHTGGVGATRTDPETTAADEAAMPLPPGTITRLASSVAGIAGVSQPYASFGGIPAEDDPGFDIRVSERLRHKERAVTLWDYERLVLATFPQIYKAKCLSTGLFDRPSPRSAPHLEPAAGVEVVVIPDIRHQRVFDPFAPKASAELLADIESHLRSRAPADATVKVKNAHFVAIQVRCGVRFRELGNEGYYRSRLQEELGRFLSPWAYDDGTDVTIGGSIYANSIVDFLDRRPYVDFVSRLRLYKSDDSGAFIEVPEPPASSSGGYRVTAERPDDVLVSARGHIFEQVTEIGRGEDLDIGINFMQVELDFKIGGELTGVDYMRVGIDFTVR